MILPDHKIEQLSKNKSSSLISPFKDKHLKSSSYDLTIGDEYYIGKEGGGTSLETQALKPKQSFDIPPHAVCFILTEESINLPRDITAKISLRMTHIYAGVVLTSQPPFDPGYTGKVIVMLYNLSSKSINFKRGQRIATIEFCRLESRSKSLKVHRSVSKLHEQLEKPLISSLTKISDTSKEAKKTVNRLAKNAFTFITIVLAFATIPSLLSFSFLFNQVDTQRDKINEMRLQIESYENKLTKYNQENEYFERRLQTIKSSSNSEEKNNASLEN